MYSLICIVEGVTGSPNIQWFGPDDSQITSGVLMATLTSTLTFSGLTISDAGEYTCQSILNGVVREAMRDVKVESEFLLAKYQDAGVFEYPLCFSACR